MARFKIFEKFYFVEKLQLSEKNIQPIFSSNTFLAFLFILLFFTMPFSPHAAKLIPPPLNDICAQGKSQYLSGDIFKSIKSLEKCISHQPQNLEAQTILAKALLDAGRFSNAVDLYKTILPKGPFDIGLVHQYLKALEGAGKIEEQIPLYYTLLNHQSLDQKMTEKYLAIVEKAGKEKYPEEFARIRKAIKEMNDDSEIDLPLKNPNQIIVTAPESNPSKKSGPKPEIIAVTKLDIKPVLLLINCISDE